MKKADRVALVYASVSGIASAANIVIQLMSMLVYGGAYAVALSVLLGTAIGFPIKYVLEKKYVFAFKADNLGHDTRLFTLYGFISVFTTTFFLAIEFGFHLFFGTDAMRYLGGAIGLILGSYIKYNLDKRFVFKQGQA